MTTDFMGDMKYFGSIDGFLKIIYNDEKEEGNSNDFPDFQTWKKNKKTQLIGVLI